ncbi:MAG: hypothetical protein ACYCOU_14400 [Sulfobacillus sp.]
METALLFFSVATIPLVMDKLVMPALHLNIAESLVLPYAIMFALIYGANLVTGAIRVYRECPKFWPGFQQSLKSGFVVGGVGLVGYYALTFVTAILRINPVFLLPYVAVLFDGLLLAVSSLIGYLIGLAFFKVCSPWG